MKRRVIRTLTILGLLGIFESVLASAQSGSEVSRSAAHYLNRANAKGRLESAFADYGMAIAYAPDWAIPYVSRGIARKSKGDLQGAISDL